MIRDHDGEAWLTIEEASARVGVRKGTIYVWIHRRKIRAHTVQRRAYVPLADLARAEAEWRARAVR